MKPKIIVFTWVWNTWKSYVINKLKETWKYNVYTEIARDLFNLLKEKWITEFQKIILEKEKKRLTELKEYKGNKNIIIDRTFSDNLIYFYWNITQGKIKEDFNFSSVSGYVKDSVNLYDEVILFTTPFKESNKFDFYNNEKLNTLMNISIKSTYWDKVKEYKNSYDYIDKNNL